MRIAALFILLAAPLAAAGEDWETRCRALAGGTRASRRAAQEELRRAGPEAAPALSAAASGPDRELTGAAALVVAARRWDPENRLVDLEPLRPLDSGSAGEIADAVAILVIAGSFRTEAVVDRILSARPEAEVANLLAILGTAPPRDPGWAKIAAERLQGKTAEIRRAAARALFLHGNWRETVDLRTAMSLEKDPGVLSEFWKTAVEIARGPEDLPALPDDPALRFDVLTMMAMESRRPRMLQAAWASWKKRPTAGLPSSFGEDAPRIVRESGAEALESVDGEVEWSGDLAPSTLAALADSPRRGSRLTALNRAFDGAEGFARAAALLDDPENEVREFAESRLSNELEAWWNDEPMVRMAKFRGLARAARIAVDSSLGICSPGETAWAVREIVGAGRSSSAMATLAVEMLSAMGPDGREALLELEPDPDLGAAAANARRVVELGLGAGIEFEDGLDSRPWLDWNSFRVPWNRWQSLASSPEASDRWFAAALMGGAWDRIDCRPEIREAAGRLLEDDDSDVADVARNFARLRATDLLPEEDDLRPGEAWTRSREYTLTRLRAAADSLVPLNAETARSIFQRGDRSLVLKAAHANRFATDDLREVMYSASEPGLLPLVIRQLESLEIVNWPGWCAHAASCGPQGCRLLFAVAISADMPVRGFAVATLLGSPWGADYAAEAMTKLAGEEGEPAEAALVYAIQNGGLAWRAALPRSTADALVRAALRQATKDSPEKALLLVRNFGPQALRNATPSLLASLAADPALADAAVGARAWIGDLPDLPDRLVRGPTWIRNTALELLPGNRLLAIRSMLHAWKLSGQHREQLEPYRIRVDWQQLSLVLLDEAAWDEQGREGLLDLRAVVNRYANGSVEETCSPSLRAAEGPISPEFSGDSYADRLAASWDFREEPTPEAFGALCAAAFRGATGDEVALDAVAPRLGPETLPHLLALLGRPAPLVRSAAASAIARAAGPARNLASAALRAALEAEDDDEAGLRMLAALARLGDAEALAHFRELAASADPDTRLGAARALPFAPTRACAAILASLADDDDAAVREEAVTGLYAMTRREWRADDPPFGRAPRWIGWLDANPGAVLHDPRPPAQDDGNSYDW